MRQIITTFSIFSCLGLPLSAQEVPGVLSGTIGDQQIEFSLDCRLWNNSQSMVFGAGDGGSGRDSSGDGFAMSYSYLNGPNQLTDMFVTINQTRFNLGPVYGSDDPTGGWVIGEDKARLDGSADNFGNPVNVDLVLDCATRTAAERGYVGSVVGVFDGQSVNSPLFCGNWMPGGFLQAATEEGETPAVELVVFPSGTEGSVTVKTSERDYQWPVMPIAGTEFDVTEDTVSFAAALTERNTGREYDVDLTFECAGR